jgi:hypothetical protein
MTAERWKKLDVLFHGALKLQRDAASVLLFPYAIPSEAAE